MACTLWSKGADLFLVMSKKTTLEEFIKRAVKKHNGFYDYSKSVYIGADKKIIVICPKHGEFKQRANSHFNGAGCMKCCIVSRGNNRRTTREEFTEMATKKHNGLYDYSKSVYVGAHKKITIICQKHGEFKQTPDSHLRGSGCRKCATISHGNNRKTTQGEFIKRAVKKHNGFYDYSKSVYIKAHQKIIIICPLHGEFKQMPSSHLFGDGCLKCRHDFQRGLYTKPQEKFIEEATKKHNGFYDYSKVVYNGSFKPIAIICPTHGEFKQSADSHLRGHGCPKCNANISKIEIQWLDSISVPLSFRQQKIRINGRCFRTDAIDVENKIIWEFFGDFWHGNIKLYNPDKINAKCKLTFGELYEKTIDRVNFMESAGYKVISIWESDFKKQLTQQPLRK